MSTSDTEMAETTVAGAEPPRIATPALLLPTLTGAIFLSAALLFAVQPMFTKMVLPRLGGAPQVWSVAMVFFQAALLAGYGYAHALTRFAPGRTSMIVQLVVMAGAALTLPLSIASGWNRPPAVGEAFWLLGLFAVSIGLPFFALAANSPLLQAWFARTDHPAAKDPYFLYSASNVGSFLALLSYPVLVEPFIPLTAQTGFWSIGFYLLILLIASCSLLLWRTPGVPSPAAVLSDKESAGAAPSWRDAVIWIGLAAVPSGLLVAVTAHISTDVASVPLMWVIPLTLYLVTFVIVFARRQILPHRFVVAVQPLFIIGLVAVTIFDPVKSIIAAIAIHLAVFFVCTLVCHGELAKRRPAPRYLTAFYMWMSAGGMVGGIGAGLVAPYVFNWIAEYPILIALAVLCRPGLALPKSRIEQIILFGGMAIAVSALILFRVLGFETPSETAFQWVVIGLLVVTVLFWTDPLPFAAIIAFVLFANHTIMAYDGSKTVRSFFGVLKVSETWDGRFRTLSHGTTLHGGQQIREADGSPVTGRPQPMMYYYDGSAIAQVLDAAHAKKPAIRYAVIGLGTGSLACRSQPGDTVNYFEIDPAIIRIANESFTFLKDCGPVEMTVGDARLTLAETPDGSYDAIIVDAFTSDAIPIHLLTQEAMAIYQKKLAPGGIVAIHVSNRHLELASVVTGIAAANGMVARVSESSDVAENDDEYVFLATVVAAARKDEDFGPMAQSEAWVLQEPDPNQRVWTDDYSNIVGSIVRKLQE
jgi:hypothetical protein